jgi:hypothetical protein
MLNNRSLILNLIFPELYQGQLSSKAHVGDRNFALVLLVPVPTLLANSDMVHARLVEESR